MFKSYFKKEQTSPEELLQMEEAARMLSARVDRIARNACAPRPVDAGLALTPAFAALAERQHIARAA